MAGAAGGEDYPLRTETLDYLQWIPVRLTFPERKRQRLVKAAVLATDYTNVVDVGSLEPQKRTNKMLKELYNFFLGIYVAENTAQDGAAVCLERDLAKVERPLTAAFELARRYKIMNPEIMRADYGKLLYIMQDAMSHPGEVGFHVQVPIVTVVTRARELGVEDLLSDPRLPLATTPVPRLPTLPAHNRALRRKDKTVKDLVDKYAGGGTSYGHYSYSSRMNQKEQQRRDDVERLIRSIDDCNCYMQDNYDTILQMVDELRRNFSPTRPDPGFELGISEGAEGSRLTHDHGVQYHYVEQSLMLWKNIIRDMYRLWLTMEEDLLNPKQPYRFTDTGQGYNRVQQSPNLYRAMEEVLAKTKREMGGEWIGTDRIHMGDPQVPNGFNFIDKYTNVARIINPILRTCNSIDTIAKDAEHLRYFEQVWGSKERLKRYILCDFFRHGFDGSGGSNDMDAGNCIDGRLTSAWQWCSLLKTKPYYPVFLLAGFSSFDGDFE
eukprot:TRINITY_DN1632_c0_g1_i1.p1 TRINITY_DN1632_c0_g1~~TRINITY_DN1632_c0_g1_i1.p1  ORF type:complete len:493 (+),score=186.51 TRINITY_DN1632_c0_g1_i1:211-1689(+)